MSRLLNPEIAFGFILGVFGFLFLSLVLSYQANHCANYESADQPRSNIDNPCSPTRAEFPAVDKGNRAIDKNVERGPIGCGFMGFGSATVNFVDDNEGFFVAFVTFLLALSTYRVWRSTEKLWETTRDSVTLARNEFISSQRPKLRVRNIYLDRPGPWFHDQIFHPAQPVTGQFFVANIGGTAAHIKDSYVGVFCFQGALPMKRPYEGEDSNRWIPCATVEAGQSTPGFLPLTVLNEAEVAGIKKGSYRLFVMGWIEYEDDRSIRRRTAFCRKFRRGADALDRQGRFVVVRDPDYEHEE
jgi:hypothetical protein